MGTLLWTPVIVLVLTSSASGLFCSFGLDKILSGKCKITTVDSGNCSLIDGVLLPSLCVCAPGFFGTKCKATIITVPDIFCGNGGPTDKVSCLCYDIFNTCKMIVVGPGTTISPSLKPLSTSTPTSIFTDISSTGKTTHITTTDITSELSSESTSTDSPSGKTTSASPEPPTGKTTSASTEPPTGETTSASPEPPTASTSASPEPPTGETTSASPEPPTASTSVSPKPPTGETTSASPEPPTGETTSASPKSPTITEPSVSPEPSTNPTELTSTGLTEVTNPTSPGSISTLDSSTTDLCSKYFYGKDCKFIYSEIRLDLVIIKLVISIHIQKEYNSSLMDSSSSDYQNLKELFLGEMTNVYKKLFPRFKEIKIVSFRQGSVIVNHEVLLEVDYRNCRKEAAQAEDILRDYLINLNCTSYGPDWLCYNVNNTFKIEDINDSDLCSKEESIPQVMKPYFSAVNMSKYLLCVTECSVKHQSPINCNWGQCSVNDNGPICYCDTSNEYWYTGDRCQTPVSKPGVIGGVVVGLIVLVAIILLLVICLCCRRRRSASKDLPVDTNPRWDQQGWERDIREQGRLRNPETDNIMIGPRGPFHTTLETVNPEARISLPRPQTTS